MNIINESKVRVENLTELKFAIKAMNIPSSNLKEGGVIIGNITITETNKDSYLNFLINGGTASFSCGTIIIDSKKKRMVCVKIYNNEVTMDW